MSWDNIHVDDYGWTGRLRIVQDGNPVDISSYTGLTFLYTKPGASTPVEKTASFDVDGVDGWLKYLHEEGFIDTTGEWSVFARVTKTGKRLTSRVRTFIVLDEGE